MQSGCSERAGAAWRRLCVQAAEAPQSGFCHQVTSPVLPLQWGPLLWDFQQETQLELWNLEC